MCLLLLEIAELNELMEETMKEVIALANAMGISLEFQDIVKFHHIIKTFAPEGKTSMHQDIEAGRKTEVEMFAGTMMELREKHNIPTPYNRMMFHLIRTKEKMNELNQKGKKRIGTVNVPIKIPNKQQEMS